MDAYMVWIWLVALGFFILIEALTVQLTTMCFAVGAFVAFLLTLFGVKSIPVQVIVFLVVSFLTLVIARPFVKKYLIKKSQPTNADRCIGNTAVVTEDINNLEEVGAVKINGLIWSARSVDDVIISKGATVTVKAIDGVKLIVSKGE